MSISIDHAEAERLLLEAHGFVLENALAGDAAVWKDRVDRLGELCPYRKSSTFVAALGTAILAKSVDTRVDPYCLLDRDDSERSYSARSLADNVWAKQRAYLRIDLGANGANPLNNTPFIGKSSIEQIRNVRNAEGYAYLMDCLRELEAIESESVARQALRGFISSRIKRSAANFQVGEAAGDYFVIPTLAGAISTFVREDSEDGRRAQAAAGGIAAACFGANRVDFGHVNDPDRNFPLDIAIRAEPNDTTIICGIEVKDKPVDGAVVLATVEKAVANAVPKLVLLAVASNQKPQTFSQEHEFARDSGCVLSCVFDWPTYLKLCVGLDLPTEGQAFGSIYQHIGEALVRRNCKRVWNCYLDSASAQLVRWPRKS